MTPAAEDGPGPGRFASVARDAAVFAALALAVYGTAMAAIELPREFGRVSPIWAANAVALAALVAAPGRRWALLLWATVAGNVLANVTAGNPFHLVAGFSACNTVEVAAGSWLLRRVVGRTPDFSHGRDLMLFCVIGGLITPLISAVLAAAMLGMARDDHWPQVLASWAIADGLGIMLFAPTILTLRRARTLLKEIPLTPLSGISLAVLVAVTAAVFSLKTPVLFLIAPALMFVVFQLEMVGAAVGVTIVALIGVFWVSAGLGPWTAVAFGTGERLIVSQIFLAVMLLSSLPTASVLAQRRRLQQEVARTAAEAAEQYRRVQMAEDVAGVAYFSVDNSERSTFWSPRMLALFGFTEPPADLEAAIGRFHPEDRERIRGLITGALLRGDDYEAETRLLLADGEVRYLFGRTVCHRSPDGKVAGLTGTVLDVTPMRRAEAKAAESEAQIRHLAANVTDVIVQTDLNGVLVYISPSVEGLLGHKPEDLIGTPNLNLVVEEDRQRVTDTVLDCLRSRGKTGMATVEYRGLTKDGRELWLESRPRTIVDPKTGRITAITDVVRDVTERKLAEAALAESEARFRQLAEVSQDIIVRVGMDGVISYISPSVRRYGYEPSEIIGKPRGHQVHPDDLERTRRLVQLAISGETPPTVAEREHRLRAANGEWRWVEGSPAVIRDETGKVVEVVTALRDVTERKEMEAQVQAARAEAEAAAAVKGEFLANMSHELRTPLTSVLGFTRLALEQPELSDTSREYIGRAARAGQALLTTVNDILDFSKLEAGQVEIRPRPCDVAEVARQTLELFDGAATEKGLSLAFEAGKLPAQARIDPDRLRQLLLNLIGNAVKFSDRGEIRVALGWKRGRLSVSVSDQGPGIAPEQQARLFQRFSQVDGSSTRRHGGTGLGLAICMGLAEAMGGSIGVESREGEGSRFFFELPAPAVSRPKAAAPAEPDALLPPGLRVLVADDHPVNRELVRAVLSPLGAVVAEAADGEQAVRAAAEAPFDLILMDLRMPGVDGLAATRAIRAAGGPNSEAPIVAFSAGSEALETGMLAASGFDGALAKPMLPAELIATVAACTAVSTPALETGHAA